MSKWEYTCRRWQRPLTGLSQEDELNQFSDLLNEMGESGWQLVHFKPFYTADTNHMFTVWMRER